MMSTNQVGAERSTSNSLDGPAFQLSKPLQHLLGGASPAGIPKAPAISKAAARLLSKSQQEKTASLEEPIATSKSTSAGERAVREKELEKVHLENERIRTSKIRIRVTLNAMKHLPKMDMFGKTDAYCIFSTDNTAAGGQILTRKSSVVKRNLDPEWVDEHFFFEVFDYPSQVLKAECWDWDGSGKDEFIGEALVSLNTLKDEPVSSEWYELHDRQNNAVTGYDGSKSIVKISLHRDYAHNGHDSKFNAQSILGDSSEIRTLDCTASPWESSARGLMFDIDNKSPFPIMITGFHSAAGRGKVGNCSYTIYRTPGQWRVGRCPCNSFSPCKYCVCCCGSCPSGRPNFRCMKCCCRCTPAGNERSGCCCWGECGEGQEIAEPCCEGCIPCCTGRFGINPILVPCFIPLCSFGCGCCTGEKLGGVGVPGIPAIGLWRCNGCKCCRDGVNRHGSLNCSFCSCCCHYCRKKYYDRRRWTRVTSGWIDLPSDWGKFAPLPTLKDFEGGGILIPPLQKTAVYIHCAHPEQQSGDSALAIRGPFTREYNQGDPVEEDDFIRIRTGPYTMSNIPFANSDLVTSENDGQFYKMRLQNLQEYASCAFVGKIDYQVLPKSATPIDCVTLCGMCPFLC